jgi:hypothetical protein
MADEKIEMTAYSGSRGEEVPRSFVLDGEKVEVFEIPERWIEEELKGKGRKRFFRVKGSDGYVYKLYYDEGEKTWFMSV